MNAVMAHTFRLASAFAAWNAKDQRQLICVVLGCAVLIVYFPVFDYPFVAYDDAGYVFENPNVNAGLTKEGLWWALTTLHGDTAYWHPLTWISHQIDYQFFGRNAGGHHVTSVAIHAANAGLVFLIVARLIGSVASAFAVALLFALHPLRVESVAWISERKDVLCGFFFFGSIWLYLRYAEKPSLKRYSAVFAGLLCALASKPMAVSLPIVFLLLDFSPLRRFSIAGSRLAQVPPEILDLIPDRDVSVRRAEWLRHWARLIGEKLPFLALAAVISAMTVQAQADLGAITGSDEISLSDRSANAMVACIAYCWKTLLPINLAVHYAHPGQQPLGWVWASAVAFALLSGALFQFRHRRPLLLFGWLYFLGTLVPTIGLVQAGSQSMADRYTYIPTLGLCVMFVGLLTGGMSNALVYRLCLGGMFASAPLLAMIARIQLSYWTDSLSLFQRAATVDPYNWMPICNVGKQYQARGEQALALQYYQRAILLGPSSDAPYVALGDFLAREGKQAAAIPFYFEALRIGGRSADLAHTNLGKVYDDLGDTGRAIWHYREALRVRRKFVIPEFGLAEILATAAHPEFRNGQEAVSLLENMLKRKGHVHPEVLEILAAAYAETGQFERAFATTERVLNEARLKRDRKLEKRALERFQLYKEGRPFHRSQEKAGSEAAQVADWMIASRLVALPNHPTNDTSDYYE